MVIYILTICGIILMLWGIGMYVRMTCCHGGDNSRRPAVAAGTNHESRNYLRTWLNKRRRARECNRNGTNRSTTGVSEAAQDNVWSVSREINQIYGPPPNYQWPTHDQHISLDSFSLRSGDQSFVAPPAAPTNNTTGRKIAPQPPPYNEVELPSYDEAVSVELQHNIYENISTPGRTQTT